MRRALARGRLDQALQLLQSPGATATMRELVAAAGLASDDPAAVRLALRIASGAQLDAAVGGALKKAERWRLVLGALASRKDTRRLLALLDRVVSSTMEPARLVDLLEALAWLEARPSETVVVKLLARPEGAVVVAASRLTSRGALLDSPLVSFDKDLKVAGPVAVRQRALGTNALADEIIKRALASAAAAVTLEAIQRQGLRASDAALEALARGKASAAVRALAIDALADRAPLGVLYTAVKDGDPAVQIAGARALVRAKGDKKAISYRLADLAARARGQAQAEALAALAQIGEQRFRDDTLRRARLLDPKHQALVAESLGSYGDKAVPTLARMLAHSSPALRAAAARGLARIQSPAAEKLLASQPPPAPAAKPSALQALLQEAVRLSGGK
jgi:hypothetical protein